MLGTMVLMFPTVQKHFQWFLGMINYLCCKSFRKHQFKLLHISEK